MPIEVSEQFTTTQPPEAVFQLLRTPEHFASLLPGFESGVALDDMRFSARVRIEMAHIQGTVTLEFTKIEAIAPQRIVYRSRGTLMNSPISLDLTFKMTPSFAGTHVVCTAAADVAGKLRLLAAAMLDPMTRENLKQLVANIQAALDAAGSRRLAADVRSSGAVVSAPADEYSYEI